MQYTQSTHYPITRSTQSFLCTDKVIRQRDFFTKEMSKMVAGVAVLLMMSSHLFMYPFWLSNAE